MEHIGLFLLSLYLGCSGLSAGGYQFDDDYLVPPKCRACDVKSCPLLTFCAGVVLKDQCGCCQRCSSDLFQPHVQPYKSPPPEMPTASPPTTTAPSLVDVCERRQCPKFKLCVVNQQGLPICTCPSELICRRKRTRRNNRNKEGTADICGTDGVTYQSKCHLKVANCNSERRIKYKHDGVCTADDVSDARRGKDKGESKPGKQIIHKLDQNTGEEKLDKLEQKWLRKEKRKERKQRRKEKQRKRKKDPLSENYKRRTRNRRMKRRNEGYSVYPSNYDMLFESQTQWSSNQVRKSKI
ncbi:uncharacterized protein LOC127870825 isoform X2 [Dreissena polymorpha]|uniref:uncharacterized protein LOC127870825 isoform X2 n=1 Tax=Dreissena polymorpha TaxID=45954 RepID=UPI0022643A17|nr:uncharacterized protein LOC127870825 isoform X2 [Dreissena polymorpha]